MRTDPPVTAATWPRAAEVTDANLRAAERLINKRQDAALLFGPHTSRWEVEERDLAAVGTLLTYRCQERETLVAAAHAMGRVIDRHTYEDFAVARLGVPLLGGQVAARALHRILSDQHGPEGYEALAAAIGSLSPPADGTKPRTVPGHLGMALGRMLNSVAGGLLEPWQRTAVQALARAPQVHVGNDRALSRRAAARCVRECVTELLRHHADTVVEVRHQVLTELCPTNELPIHTVDTDDPAGQRTPAEPPAMLPGLRPDTDPDGLMLELLSYPPQGAGSVEQLRGVTTMFLGGPDIEEDPGRREARRILAIADRRGQTSATSDPRRRTHDGLVLIAGETAARLLHRIITDRHGPYGFEAIADLADTLHPVDLSSRRPGGPMPEMQARRLLNGPLGQLLHPWQHRAVQAMTARSRGMDPVACAATVAARVSPYVLAHREMIPVVRAAVLSRYRPGLQVHTAEAPAARDAG
ncbi:hypothetical protein ACFWGI_06775 [Streptomyces niveus]|uniref:hypothetical protein n=1 Tax=Streptomyces niveus TaxID=193462 RepID=UPI00365F18F5